MYMNDEKCSGCTMLKFLLKWYITGEWCVLYTSVRIYDATEVVANQLGLKELFYAFCSYLWEQQRRQLTASFFSLSSPFLIRQLMKWPLFSTLPPPMSHCFVSKNRHSLEERARGYTAPFSEAPRICMRPVRVWKTRRKETIFVSEKREKTWWKTNEIRFHFGKGFWKLKAERNSYRQTFDHHKKEKIVFTIKRGIKKFLSVSHRHPWVGHSHLATQTNNVSQLFIVFVLEIGQNAMIHHTYIWYALC